MNRAKDEVRGRCLERTARFARRLDAQWGIPFTPFRIGVDGLIGLLPVGGDIAGAVLSLLIVADAKRCGAPAGVIVRMLVNIALDVVLGSVPILGDLFDIAFKANLRNARLLERHLHGS